LKKIAIFTNPDHKVSRFQWWLRLYTQSFTEFYRKTYSDIVQMMMMMNLMMDLMMILCQRQVRWLLRHLGMRSMCH